ncbi:hypothetical protein [Rhodovarius crocodyli]|nr:hypothetical protein [Rhodovarius crocodyli]
MTRNAARELDLQSIAATDQILFGAHLIRAAAASLPALRASDLGRHHADPDPVREIVAMLVEASTLLAAEALEAAIKA